MISQEDAERYKEALERIVSESKLTAPTITDHDRATDALWLAQEALNPPPETEEVKVTHYAIYRKGYHVTTYPTREEAEEFMKSNNFFHGEDKAEIVELVGKTTRPKKKLVTRREEIGVLGEICGVKFHTFPADMPVGAKIEAVWQEEQ